MALKRRLGRPARGSAENGRDSLIDATRRLLRTNPALVDHRSQVARAAGVTPALVCYHFPSHADLIEAAARPVVECYMRELFGILESPVDDEGKLRAVIDLLVRVNAHDPNLIDRYVEILRTKGDEDGRLEWLLGGFRALVAFFERSGYAGSDRAPHLAVFALWGMCRSLAQHGELPMALVGGDVPDGDTQAMLVAEILRLMSRGREPTVGPGANGRGKRH